MNSKLYAMIRRSAARAIRRRRYRMVRHIKTLMRKGASRVS